MSGHRAELRVSFTVGDTNGREDAEAVVRTIEALSYGHPIDEDDAWPSDFEVTPIAVDGNGWHEKWPPRPKPAPSHATAADADAALASGLETYNDLDKAIERLRQLQSDVREEMKALSYFRNRAGQELAS